jgi:hypothetical protein
MDGWMLEEREVHQGWVPRPVRHLFNGKLASLIMLRRVRSTCRAVPLIFTRKLDYF